MAFVLARPLLESTRIDELVCQGLAVIPESNFRTVKPLPFRFVVLRNRINEFESWALHTGNDSWNLFHC